MSSKRRQSEYLLGIDVREQQWQSDKSSTFLEYLCSLNIDINPGAIRQTSIICTIGPVSHDVDTLKQLIDAGMNIARMNFSHGTHEYHKETITNVREAAKDQYPHPVAIALDTKGPEIRTGLLKSGPTGEVELTEGQTFKLSLKKEHFEQGDKNMVYVDYANLAKTVKKSNKIFMDDGLIALRVTEVAEDHVMTVVENSGMLGSKKGVNLPEAIVDLPAVSEKDKADILFGVENGIDMIFASFIRKASDIRMIRAIMGPGGKNIKIIAKIENHEGVRNFDNIIKVADGIMVARGDLGIEIPTEKVFIAQKMMVGKCARDGIPVIIATQMLESMIQKPRPTRAEGSDVANAVLDGADCVMLSGETAKGKYPVRAVEVMHKICCEAEAAIYHRQFFNDIRQLIENPPVGETIAMAAVDASFKQKCSAIICMSHTGTTGHLLSKYRPRCPIITITRDERAANQLHLYRGCFPLIYDKHNSEDWFADLEDRVDFAIKAGREMGFLKVGASVVLVSGWKFGPRHTNTIRIIAVEEEKTTLRY